MSYGRFDRIRKFILENKRPRGLPVEAESPDTLAGPGLFLSPAGFFSPRIPQKPTTFSV
jgi:hypothetical protein